MTFTSLTVLAFFSATSAWRFMCMVSALARFAFGTNQICLKLVARVCCASANNPEVNVMNRQTNFALKLPTLGHDLRLQTNTSRWAHRHTITHATFCALSFCSSTRCS